MIDPFGLGLAIGAVVGFVFAAFIFRHPRPCPRTRDKGPMRIVEELEATSPLALAKPAIDEAGRKRMKP